jgi:hypothetical protein
MKLEYFIHPDYLQVVAEGEFNLTDAKLCIDNVYKLCDEHKYAKVLIDSRGVPDQVSLASRFSLAEHLVAGYPRPIRIAMLCSTAQVQFTKLLENATNNRGALVLTTDSDAAARAYLKLA